jgi:glycosyltransferase involved in cell wall biosynthesis
MGENITEPIISIIMPAYNAENYIAQAIQSILNQTFTNFEFIIINDGSIDKTESIIKKFNDPRIIYVKNELNKNIVESLNIGIDLAKGPYIARMDADDIADKFRFEKQLNYLNRHDLDVIGSNAISFGNFGQKKFLKMPEKESDLSYFFLLYSPFLHPTIFGKSECFKIFKYKKKFEFIEDLYLWYELLVNNYRIGNLPQTTLKYRISSNQITQIKFLEQESKSNELRGKYFQLYTGNYKDNFSEFLSQLRLQKDKNYLRYWLNLFFEVAEIKNVSFFCRNLLIVEILRRSPVSFFDKISVILPQFKFNFTDYWLIFRSQFRHIMNR